MKKYIALFLILAGLTAYAQVGVNVSLVGSVTDEVSKKALKATIKILDLNGKNIARPIMSNETMNGAYAASGLKPGQKLIVRVECPGYFSQDYNVEVPDSKEYAEISRDFTIKPMAVGTMMPFRVYPFDRNKSKLREGADYIFETMLFVMKRNPTSRFEIICYPDDSKNPVTNFKLTTERCEAIKEYYVSKGIAADRLTVLPFANIDTKNPPPTGKAAKGKRYKGSIYLKILAI